MGLGMWRRRKEKGSFYVYKEKMGEKISKTCVMFLVWFELERGFIIVWLSKLFCQCFHWVWKVETENKSAAVFNLLCILRFDRNFCYVFYLGYLNKFLSLKHGKLLLMSIFCLLYRWLETNGTCILTFSSQITLKGKNFFAYLLGIYC